MRPHAAQNCQNKSAPSASLEASCWVSPTDGRQLFDNMQRKKEKKSRTDSWRACWYTLFNRLSNWYVPCLPCSMGGQCHQKEGRVSINTFAGQGGDVPIFCSKKKCRASVGLYLYPIACYHLTISITEQNYSDPTAAGCHLTHADLLTT